MISYFTPVGFDSFPVLNPLDLGKSLAGQIEEKIVITLIVTEQPEGSLNHPHLANPAEKTFSLILICLTAGKDYVKRLHPT
jgi:hypothetical protein